MTLPSLCSSAPSQTRSATSVRILIVGNRGGTNIAESFERGARSLRVPIEVLESKAAMAGPTALRLVKWHLLGHIPAELSGFSNVVVEYCAEQKPGVLLTTGLAPINEKALSKIGDMGIRRCNYLTDDPWNPAHRSRWFLRALAKYDHVFTPRRANMLDLQNISDAKVSFLPFGYDPELFYPVQLEPGEIPDYASEVMFAGGADSDRARYIAALDAAGVRVALFGSYWERFAATRAMTRGQIGVDQLRNAIAGCRIALCLVRRANRDGHSMRTFELAASGACMLAEDTEEHREILGQDGEAAVYFRSIPEMVERCHWLLDRPEERNCLAIAAQRRIVNGRNTYQDRLAAMLGLAVH